MSVGEGWENGVVAEEDNGGGMAKKQLMTGCPYVREIPGDTWPFFLIMFYLSLLCFGVVFLFDVSMSDVRMFGV